MAKGKNVNVGPSKSGGWEVKKSGNERASAKTETQKKAIEIGRDLARKERSELTVRGENGRIREKNSYGNDPQPPKDKR